MNGNVVPTIFGRMQTETVVLVEKPKNVLLLFPAHYSVGEGLLPDMKSYVCGELDSSDALLVGLGEGALKRYDITVGD